MGAKIIAVTNQKGGVGKTTTAVNLAASLGAAKKRVLLVDFDPQGNATMGSGVLKKQIDFSVADVLLKLAPLSAALKTPPVGYDLLPASSQLTAAELQLVKEQQREYALQKLLEELVPAYDFILIDCPPALNLLTVNALVAADSVIVPIQCEYYALEGLASLLDTIQQLRAVSNQELELEGLLRTMYDGRNRLTQEVSAQLLEHFGERVYQTVIPRNVRLAEAPSHGVPALLYDANSPGAIAYLALAGELCKQNQRVNREYGKN